MLTRDPFFGRQAAKPSPTQQQAAASGAQPAAAAQPTQPLSPPGNSGTAADASPQGSQLIVGPNIKLKGVEITDCDTLVVEGHVEATMDSRAIRIAHNGTFSGTAGIDVAEIHGGFTGELTVRKCLTIHAGGKVSGKVRYGRVVIEEGGEISGDIKKLSDEEKSTRIQAAAPGVKTMAAVHN